MRKVAVVSLLLVAVSACSVPRAETLNCGEDQSIFACQAKFSDGKSRNIVFVKAPAPGQTVLDEVTTRDDLGNEYCVTLYQNVTATYVPGECGSIPPIAAQPMEPTSTSVDPLSKPQGVSCVEGLSVDQCRVAYSDGTNRRVQIVDSVPDDFVKLDSDPHIDESGLVYCVTAYGRAEEARLIFELGADGC